MNREAEFLNEQVAIAKIRLRLHASSLVDELVAPLRLGSLVRQKPWWSLGGALIGGFLAGFGLRAFTKSKAVRTAPARIRQLVRTAPIRIRQILRTAPERIRRLVTGIARNGHRVLGGAMTIVAAHLREGAHTPAPPSSNGHSSHSNGHSNGHSKHPSR